jgi:hypothetical protein
VRSKSLRGSRHRRLESVLLVKRPWNVHDSMIARPATRWTEF